VVNGHQVLITDFRFYGCTEYFIARDVFSHFTSLRSVLFWYQSNKEQFIRGLELSLLLPSLRCQVLEEVTILVTIHPTKDHIIPDISKQDSWKVIDEHLADRSVCPVLKDVVVIIDTLSFLPSRNQPRPDKELVRHVIATECLPRLNESGCLTIRM
jgi:hypothetical protein